MGFIVIVKIVKFDRHAKRRMKWRKISEEEVILVISQPDFREPEINNRVNAFKKISDRNIKVTYTESETEIYVITTVVKKLN